MNSIFWSFLLAACIVQSIFLIIVFAIRPQENKKASSILMVMLAIILCTTISNLVTSSLLYKSLPAVAGFARGMVLLLGPVLYLYIAAITDPGFSFKPKQLFHFIPYLVAVLVIKLERVSLSYSDIIANIDKLMKEGVLITGLSIWWFITYFVHLLFYIVAARRQISLTVSGPEKIYLIPTEQRVKWIKRFSFFFILIVLLFIGHTAGIILTGRVSIITNYIYNLVLTFIVYRIAFQAISDGRLLSPGFAEKYKSTGIPDPWGENLSKKLVHLFEKEQIFTDPDLTLTSLAAKADTSPHIISQTINRFFNKSFSDFVNHYRIDEFKKRVALSHYVNYSIIGVAYDVGYKNKSTFNSAFKKQTGITPSEYLKSVS